MPRSLVPPDHAASPLAVQRSVSKKHRSPWLIVLAGGIISLAAVIVLGLLLNLVSEDMALPEFEYQATMPDGTLLVVEAVSWGSTHNLDVRGLSRSGLFNNYSNSTIYHSTPGDRLVVFMRRFDPKTGAALDFTWWGSSAAVDSFGSEIPDANPYQQALYGYGSSSGGGSRPMSSPSTFGYYNPQDPSYAVVAHSDFPAIRVDGDTFHLLVKNVAGEVVAEFDLPYKGTRATEVWAPDSLPATQTSHGLTMTLTGMNATLSDYPSTYNGVEHYDTYLSVLAEFEYNGTAVTDWYPNIVSVTDPLGNESSSYNPNLSWGEPAWKVRLTAGRSESDWNTIPLAPGESAEIGTFTLPEPGWTSSITGSGTANGRTFNWNWIGGHRATFSLGRSAVYSSSWSSYVNVDGNYISLDLREDYSSPRQLTVGGDVFTIVGFDPTYGSVAHQPQFVEVKISTLDGVAVPSSSAPMGDLLVTAFLPPPDVTEIKATFIVRNLPEFEFLVAPPEKPPIPPPVVPGEPIPVMVPTTPTEEMMLPDEAPSVETPVPEPPPPMSEATEEQSTPSTEATEEPAATTEEATPTE